MNFYVSKACDFFFASKEKTRKKCIQNIVHFENNMLQHMIAFNEEGNPESIINEKRFNLNKC